ncbi:hypothetical protein BG015_007968 [Linnemannia schmuckeri]|uniref:Uncharacterized protein n=1 Tax=Linnemannia schmuckeri TaxID=64567 RepID=A0A9P5S5W9_9FUNG|nr:hypothetical protein BG015_007968 [Linnemannia schmuckeri]
MLSYTMYTTIDPTTVSPMVNVEERGRRLHTSNNVTSSSPSSSTYASDEEDDHIEPLKSNSRRNSILNFCYGLPSNSNSRSNSRTRSRSRSRPNIKVQDAPDAAAVLYSLATRAPITPSSPKQSTNNSRRSSVELREEYAELLEERSRPSSRVNSRANSRSNSRIREPHHSHSRDHDNIHLTINHLNFKDVNKKEKDHCGSDCATCTNCNTIKDTVLELDESNTPSKIQKPRRKSHEVTGPYDAAVESSEEESQNVDNIVPSVPADSIERKLGFDMSLLSF